ncbi:MAG: type II secretion system protein GspD, partial [Planctomycetota bacterium]
GEGGGAPPFEPPATSNVEMLLEQFPTLIEWPQGSFTYLDRKMNLLYVRTTREAYKEALRLLEPIDQIPHQVLIKTLFVEIKLEDFETFGVTTDISCTDATDEDEQLNLSTLLNFPQEQLPGLTSPDSGGTFNIVGVMSETQFDVALDALQRTGTTRTLAAPNVICVNNCTAKISVTRDLIYVEDYEVDRSDISGTTYGNPFGFGFDPDDFDDLDPNDINNFNRLSSEPIIIPVFAEGEDTGFTLDVAPSIGKDTRYITLMLNPRIREEIPPRLSFELVFPTSNFGTGTTNGQDGEQQEAQQQTATVERPIIGERSLATKLTVADGAVVALGGLIQQKKIQVRSKVPILSDIPVLGQFFTRSTYRDEKTNLLIFVQAELITPTGARYADSGRIDATRAAEEAARVEIQEATAPVFRPEPPTPEE